MIGREMETRVSVSDVVLIALLQREREGERKRER